MLLGHRRDDLFLNLVGARLRRVIAPVVPSIYSSGRVAIDLPHTRASVSVMIWLLLKFMITEKRTLTVWDLWNFVTRKQVSSVLLIPAADPGNTIFV